jgi:hypothetical protein
LCSAYINVSKDPIAGCNQPMGAYWDISILIQARCRCPNILPPVPY